MFNKRFFGAFFVMAGLAWLILSGSGSFLPGEQATATASSNLKQQGLNLVMFEEAGCPYCEKWKEEIGGVYNKTDEGKKAPLILEDVWNARRKYNLKGVFVSPTFVVMQDGKEIGRIIGYIEDGFFWADLEVLLKKAEKQISGSS